jgi:hypothetical protein
MKSFALIDSQNTIINISQADDDWSADGWIEYDETNPAFVGGDFVDGFFYPPQPFASWSRDQGKWRAPIEMPNDGKFYHWDEIEGDWVE